MHQESRVNRLKKFATFAATGAGRVLFSRPVTIWSVSGRNRAAVDHFVQLFNMSDVPEDGRTVLGLEGYDVRQAIAGQPFGWAYARGWRCDRGLAVGVSSTEDTLTNVGAAGSVILRVEYEYAADDRGA